MAHMIDAVKEAVSMPAVARLYGFEVNRGGYIACPFHNERTPSCRLYADGYHCFGCGAHGDAVDFVARIFGLSQIEAARKLNDDLRLGLSLDRHQDPEALRERQRVTEAKRLFDAWRGRMLDDLDACIRLANLADFDNLTDVEAEALRFREAFEYWADILMHGSMDEQMAVFRDMGVRRRCRKILSATRTKSPAA